MDHYFIRILSPVITFVSGHSNIQSQAEAPSLPMVITYIYLLAILLYGGPLLHFHTNSAIYLDFDIDLIMISTSTRFCQIQKVT